MAEQNSAGPWFTSTSQGPPPPYSGSQTVHVQPTEARNYYQQQPARQKSAGGSCSSGKMFGILMAVGSVILLLLGLGMGIWQLAQYIENKTASSSSSSSSNPTTPILYPAVSGIYYNTTKHSRIERVKHVYSNREKSNNSFTCDTSTRFQCTTASSGCIPYNWQCDGINDCYDNSDEARCACKTASEYQCYQGGCYTKAQICDGRAQCQPSASNTYEDEQYCYSSCPSSTHFQCQSNYRCVPLKLRCDGKNDCGDLSDEIGCTCGPTETACANGLCIKLSRWCDGVRDCRDGSDELARCQNSCPNNGVKCQVTGVCMNRAQLCDRISDCLDGSDELQCSGCPTDNYKCSDGQCIPNAWKCDGIKDCTSGEDETLSTCPQCSSTQYQCKYKRNSCIDLVRRCDSTIDCPDYSDEGMCVSQSGSGSGAKPLLVTYYGTTSNYVCTDGWTSDTSDFACRQMGMGQVKSTSSVTAPLGVTFLRTTNSNPTSGSLLQYLTPAGACASNQIVQVECEPQGCGTRAVSQASIGPYIVNGAAAGRGAWPWQVLVLYDNNVICGGSILNELWILTAGHCAVDYKDTSKITVRAGSVKFEGSDPDAQTRYVSRVILHPQYSDNAARNVLIHDVALLKLASPLTYTDTVRRICLPSSSININSFKVCVATGWGRTRSDGLSSKVLLQGRMDPMSTDTCRRSFSDLSQGTTWSASDSDFNYFICAGSYPAKTGIDICQGDSGGPLACQNQEGVWSVIGVSSFGFANCDLSVFARVPTYTDWIVTSINQSG